MNIIFKYQVHLLLALVLGGCGTFIGNPLGTDKDESGDQKRLNPEVLSTPSVSRKAINISISDAPVDNLSKVIIHIASLELKREESWTNIPLEGILSIDILELQNGKTVALGGLDDAEPGTYSELRLVLHEGEPHTVIDSAGETHSLKVPSGTSSGIKIKTDLEYNESEQLNALIDFDLRKSITKAGSASNLHVEKAAPRARLNEPLEYLLKPVIKAVNLKHTGSITGRKKSAQSMCLFLKGTKPDKSDDCSSSEYSAKINSDGTFNLPFVLEGSYKIRYYYNDGSSEDHASLIKVNAGKNTDI